MGLLTKKNGQPLISGYKEFHGIRIPIGGEAIWKLDSGDFSYIKLEIMDIEYNKPTLY